MNTKEQIEDFLKFLKNNNCLNKYLNNTKRKHKDFFLYTPLEALILGTFMWDATPEKSDFWSKINQKWRDLYKNNTL